MEIENAFYRVSIKALILDDTSAKFLLIQENDGRWELPGGGLDWGESPTQAMARELKEEMGLTVTSIATAPSYFLTGLRDDGTWAANVVYETNVAHLDFIPSDECIAIKFVSTEEARNMHTFSTVQQFVHVFDPTRRREQ